MTVFMVENTTTGWRTTHPTWQSAMKATLRHPTGKSVMIERDPDGHTRTYNTDGEIVSRD